MAGLVPDSESEDMRVAMVGSGYVGLVSGACFADFGHIVTCIDKDVSKIEALKAGKIPIFEPGLKKLVAQNVQDGRLFFTTEMSKAVREADAVFIAVGTPRGAEMVMQTCLMFMRPLKKLRLLLMDLRSL